MSVRRVYSYTGERPWTWESEKGEEARTGRREQGEEGWKV